MTPHIARFLKRLTFFAFLCVSATVWSETPSGFAYFDAEPTESLIRRIESAENRLPSGFSIEQRARWSPESRALILESALTNTGTSRARVPRTPVVSWAFRAMDAAELGPYRSLAYRNDVWYDSTYWTGSDWTRIGKNWHHPGTDAPSVRCFRFPHDGDVLVLGHPRKADTNGGDGVRLEIRHGVSPSQRGRTVWKAEIDGDNVKGVEHSLRLTVRKGESLCFLVHKRGTIACDTTYWDPAIAYADGETFLASAGFSAEPQGQGGWFYEMEPEGAAAPKVPKVHALTPDLFPLARSAAPSQEIHLSESDALPFFIVSDPKEMSGIVLAVSDAGKQSWGFQSELTTQGLLHVGFESYLAPDRELAPGESVQLPTVALAAYQGEWLGGLSRFQNILKEPDGDPFAASLRDRSEPLPELDYWIMTVEDWIKQDGLDETAEGDREAERFRAAATRQLGKARNLLADLQQGEPTDSLRAEALELDRLAGEATRSESDAASARALYLRVRQAKRRIALANPLMRFGELLFCKRVPTSYSHLVMQYYGWRARAGGGLYVLEEPGRSLRIREILGEAIGPGCILEPRLSYDAKRVVFSYVECRDKPYEPSEIVPNEEGPKEGYYHVYSVNVDGSDLRQLTDGAYDDLMPCWLPDGGIAFSSTRRGGYARCFGGGFGRRWHVYTLHRMDSGGGNLKQLSYHDTNEWFPTVSNTGHLLYARWDYIDRDAVTHQNLWATRPDGTNPMAVWGNATPKPHCTFQIQPIPGSSKVVFAASAHHSITGGPIAVVDPTVDNNSEVAVTRITPEIPFPEAESRDIREYYTSPWPLSEKYFLVGYSPQPLVWEPGANPANALGIYLLDAAGNRELLYRDPEIGSTNPCPLRPRPAPPVLASTLPPDAPETGEMLVMDIYRGLGDVARGTIASIRVIQIFPKTTPWASTPRVGMAAEENARAILGTVPVEADGSARFIVPARTPLLLQALDADGFAYQTMRSLTYVQPGESVSCVGCHESRMTASGVGFALRRPASRIEAGPLEGEPFSYVRTVQPVLDAHCVKCHLGEKPKGGIDLTGEPRDDFTRSYLSLCGDRDFWGEGTNPRNAAEALVPRFGGRNQVQVTPPGGLYGARGSRLIKMLRAGHNKVCLSREELGRLAAWIDCNAIFYGVNLPESQAEQLAGKAIAMPKLQ